VARRWRLLLDGEAPGPWNMGADEALRASAVEGGLPSLRLYGWAGAWLSLGYAQPCQEARSAACARAGVGVVRRATGGRAVLHGADLTYAVAAPEHVLPEGLRGTYQLLAGALLDALDALGLAAERSTRREPAGSGAFDCFAEPATDELCIGGRKLVGSAQRRGGGGVLQHGSLRLAPDPVEARRATGLSGVGATSLLELGCAAPPELVRDRLVAAFARALGARFEPSSLAPAEAACAARRGPMPHRWCGPAPPGILKRPPSRPIDTEE
jgi:lipoate-protein ligase A